MPSNIHFISGLPRSGSTLLSALLRQNPRFSAAVASPVASFFDALQPVLSRGEFAAVLGDETRSDMLHGVVDSFYARTRARLGANPVVFDSNRTWTARMAAVATLFPSARVICCVRDIGWILDSFECMMNKNPLLLPRLFNFQREPSVYARTEILMHGDTGLVGQSWATLHEAWFGEQAKRLVLVPYDHLVKEPKRTLQRLYAEIGEPYFEHNFNDCEYDEPEYDAYIGMPGLHAVRKKVEYRERKPSIPPDIFYKYAANQFWDKAELNSRGVAII